MNANKYKRIYTKLRESLECRLFPDRRGLSYSQSGEDRIIKYIFDVIGIESPTYLDIGAHHPTRLSNSYLFYRNGCRGVCVEPNPRLFAKFQEMRPDDICINKGVGGENQKSLPFYEMSSDTLSTFSEYEANRYVTEQNQRIVNVINVDVVTPRELIHQYFNKCPDFVSLDVEGLELEILKAFDFTTLRPQVLCVETITYETDGSGEKLTNVIEYMKDAGYMVYADTNINTIFVDQDKWMSRA